jgi:hypothetical protein
MGGRTRKYIRFSPDIPVRTTFYQFSCPRKETDFVVKKKRVMTSLTDTLFLLHHLVMQATDSSASFDLRGCLHQAPHRPFNGIAHIFTVTFARLSYADPPACLEGMEADVEVLSGTSFLLLSKVAIVTHLVWVEMARDLLDLVVDGPESESVWNAFQDDPEDPEEMEEEFLGPDKDGLGA